MFDCAAWDPPISNFSSFARTRSKAGAIKRCSLSSNFTPNGSTNSWTVHRKRVSGLIIDLTRFSKSKLFFKLKRFSDLTGLEPRPVLKTLNGHPCFLVSSLEEIIYNRTSTVLVGQEIWRYNKDSLKLSNSLSFYMVVNNLLWHCCVRTSPPTKLYTCFTNYGREPGHTRMGRSRMWLVKLPFSLNSFCL